MYVFWVLFPTKVLVSARGVVEFVFELERAEVEALENRRKNEICHISRKHPLISFKLCMLIELE